MPGADDVNTAAPRHVEKLGSAPGENKTDNYHCTI